MHLKCFFFPFFLPPSLKDLTSQKSGELKCPGERNTKYRRQGKTLIENHWITCSVLRNLLSTSISQIWNSLQGHLHKGEEIVAKLALCRNQLFFSSYVVIRCWYQRAKLLRKKKSRQDVALQRESKYRTQVLPDTYIRNLGSW